MFTVYVTMKTSSSHCYHPVVLSQSGGPGAIRSTGSERPAGPGDDGAKGKTAVNKHTIL